jgi:hypothetical protein
MKEKAFFSRANALMRAAWAVASGPTGNSPEQVHVKAYVDAYQPRIDHTREDLFNPPESSIQDALVSYVDAKIRENEFSPYNWNNLSWTDNAIYMDRTARTIISFSDDHTVPVANEFFPIDPILNFLQNVRESYDESQRKLTIPDQFEIAMKLSDNSPVAAGILAHAAYRAVGRVLDTRVSDRLVFPVESPIDQISMLNIAETTAHFPSETGTNDPLGDTYHWWGQFSANLIFELYKPTRPLQARAYQRTFYHGPDIMNFARETVFRKKQIAGKHKEADRQGQRVGVAVGQMINRSVVN